MNKKRITLNIMITACVLVTVLCAAYLVYNFAYLPWKINEDNARYAALYKPAETASPAAAVPASSAPYSSPMATLSAEVAFTPEPTPTQPAIDAEATLSPTFPAEETVPDDIKLGTPDPDTLIYVSATLPPVQESFGELLWANPETAGFLRMGDELALPVVQRPGDNEFYLEYDFEGNKSSAGCLFIDGANWLFPRDECLYIYGHNMKNGTMFGELDDMDTTEGLLNYFPVQFDTIYEGGVYIPFACFTLSADQSDSDYFQLRRFDFDAAGYTEYVSALKSRSLLDIPVDAVYGDKLLILVTCNYSINDGRFVVALRELREGETEEGARRLLELAVPK